MSIKDKNIDGGRPFDWGKVSEEYAKYRDIYPRIFYDKIISRGLCREGQTVLDIGTGTGVLPRNLYRYGAKWTAADISQKQIEQAELLSENMNIDYYAASAEELCFKDESFDVITACQCFWYFKHKIVVPELYRMLKPGGSLLILYMAWLPFEDTIAGESERLILKYNPVWSGRGETVHPIEIPDCCHEWFELIYHEEYPVKVPFTRESWNGRLKACRGVGASLSEDEIQRWEKEHREMLLKIAPAEFEILHYAAAAELRKREVRQIF